MLNKAKWRSDSRPLARLRGVGTRLANVLQPSGARAGRSTAVLVEGPPAAPPKPELFPIVPKMCTVRDDELPLLEELIREAAQLDGPIVEIGTLLGVSTTHIALWKAPAQKIITVDAFVWNPWGLTPEQHQDITTQMLHYLIQTGQVELVAMNKDDFYEQYAGGPPALVFCDAIHTYEETAKDIAWARSVGARIICGHDYSDTFDGIMKIVDELGGPRQLRGTVWRL